MSELQIVAAIEKSREQGWSELKDGAQDGAAASPHGQENQLIWETLKKWNPRIFTDKNEKQLKLGRLIAEGGQAQIYEASLRGDDYSKAVAKVFKMEGFSLADLIRQWPLATKNPFGYCIDEDPMAYVFLSNLGHFDFGGAVFGEPVLYCSTIYLGTFLKDGRFAFVMPRCWGDLRTLINRKMEDNNDGGSPFSHPQALEIMRQIAVGIRGLDARGVSQTLINLMSKDKNVEGPPFSGRQALEIMRQIAVGMRGLHARGALHRDLKAANVLIVVGNQGCDPTQNESYLCEVADYECSMLVQGTGFWRAPEVLENLMKKENDRNAEIWTEKVDTYSYAMTCYEVLTGCIPFDGYVKRDWKKVIDGERPHFPYYVDPRVCRLVERCWHKEPSARPTFEDIVSELDNMLNIQHVVSSDIFSPEMRDQDLRHYMLKNSTLMIGI